ncbi:PREDICTED: transcription factor GTE7-like isoform X1 [Papilio xuthus]|uniref:Transcription factor GTE7-like isoform X1 n=1 Tax=Papilio xuthus TaxID=66420 RepID=A0AAJ7E7R7_PAPXU|nr:PREDICTED: transcription factor GTE7-like isoform X1 [Papilio xuthus]
MRTAVYLVALCVALSAAAPAPEPAPAADPAPNPAPNPAPSADDKPEIIEIIAPAASAQETLATLNLGAPGSELSERNKRTIGILRQLFPTLTQIIEQKVQQLTSVVLRTFGPLFLRLFLGGNRNQGRMNGGTVDLEDDDDDDEDDVTTTTSTTESSRRKRALFFLPNSVAEDNLLSGAESQQAEVRVAFGEGSEQQTADDQQTAAQTNAASIDEITLEDADDNEENRNKRFLNFGDSSGSSGGGSGNFLFDIVRLVAGSSSGSAGGEAGEGAEAGKGDNLTEGVPGPITRLFIIANRGIANLIQDLILRIAQTSERIVNFKARLITSII